MRKRHPLEKLAGKEKLQFQEEKQQQ